MAAKLPDTQTHIQAGIDPKTKSPIRLDSFDSKTKTEIKKILRIMDEQDAVQRYKWYNLPADLTGEEVERLLYYKGQLCFFKLNDQFYFMPYALSGTIDYYGRYNTIHPIPAYEPGKDESKQTQAQFDAQRNLLSQLKLDVMYGMKTDEGDSENKAVILRDYTNQLSQTCIARANLNEEIIDAEAECIPYLKLNLLVSAGVKGMRVNDADSKSEVIDAAKGLKASAMKGLPYLPIISPIEFQDLGEGSSPIANDYMIAMQSLDNLRLSTYGLENGGLFEKKAHMLEGESEINSANVGLIFQDGLSIRQNFCNIVNSIWELGIWCEPSEAVLGVDADGDGVAYDEDTQEQSGVETEEGETDNE